MLVLLNLKLYFEKKKLEFIVNKYGITSNQTLKQSQRVDNLIIQYYHQIIKEY